MEYNMTQMKKKESLRIANGITEEKNNASPLLVHFQFLIWKHFKGLAIHSIPVFGYNSLIKHNYLE